jgi:hypothetical protein
MTLPHPSGRLRSGRGAIHLRVIDKPIRGRETQPHHRCALRRRDYGGLGSDRSTFLPENLKDRDVSLSIRMREIADMLARYEHGHEGDIRGILDHFQRGHAPLAGSLTEQLIQMFLGTRDETDSDIGPLVQHDGFTLFSHRLPRTEVASLRDIGPQ